MIQAIEAINHILNAFASSYMQTAFAGCESRAMRS
jgi:hypothetical protein